jgi:hypothetical protein
MTKPMSERTHKAQVEHSHKVRGLTPSQIRANKCQRSKARNAARKAERRAEAEERQRNFDRMVGRKSA